MMKQFDVFVSYSHADEWLKNELIKHFSALVRNGVIDVWHDRKIPAGTKIDAKIDERVRSADLFLFLISNDFIDSDYCFHREYEIALERHRKGEVEIVPIIVRDCDWDVGGLRSFKALPTDAVPVTRKASSRSESQERDPAWLDVINGLKGTIAELKKKITPPNLNSDYLENLFLIDNIRHPLAQRLDERVLFVDPNIYFENVDDQITRFSDFLDTISEQTASIVTGGDRSGKTLLSKLLQVGLHSRGEPSLLLKGKEIRTAAFDRFCDHLLSKQYGVSSTNKSLFTVIIDDFDDCSLSDRVKENIVEIHFSNF